MLQDANYGFRARILLIIH